MAERQGGDQLVSSVAAFLDRTLPPERHRAILAAGGWDEGLHAELTALGWAELTADPDDCGLGVSLAELGGLAGLVGERLVPEPLVEQLVLPALLRGGWPAPGCPRSPTRRSPSIGPPTWVPCGCAKAP